MKKSIKIILILAAFVLGILLTRNRQPAPSPLEDLNPVNLSWEINQVENVVRVPIFLYHYVSYPKDINDKTRVLLTTYPDKLDEQIKTLMSSGYAFITAMELADILDGSTSPRDKLVALTFDDGYEDFYQQVFPILKKNNVKATVFIIAGNMGKKGYLSADQILEMAKSGVVEIGAHGVSHTPLLGLSQKKVEDEVVESKRTLENIINKPVVSFSYPFGSFDKQTIEIVKRAGFRSSVSTVPGTVQSRENQYFLYRLRPENRVDEELLSLINENKNIFKNPLDRTRERVTKKKFGQWVTDRFVGYHTGVDLEVFPDELNEAVSVEAVCSGKLRQKEYAAGYGGVVVQDCNLNNEPVTVIYGHLKLASVTSQNDLKTGDILGLLGADYSRETDGERKHLHLGIHTGSALNIRGYVSSISDLSNWIDPLTIFN